MNSKVHKAANNPPLVPGSRRGGLDCPHTTTYSTRNTCPPHVFNQLTDILADLVLEDLKQFPQIPTGPCVDRFGERENTVLLTQEAAE